MPSAEFLHRSNGPIGSAASWRFRGTRSTREVGYGRAMPDEEKLRSAIHDELMAGGDVGRVLRLAQCDRTAAHGAIDQVIADYVTELDSALRSGRKLPYGVDASTFMRQYDRLWLAKQDF